MTAALSPQLAESYERADIKDLFFSSDETRKTDILQSANRHR
ncbi:hypothetical protein HD842_001847 [Massilia aurea]|jgi:hypothetical protein|uniref:Uncharacterized protein n=1 Tax=Massilia aurea TaxID=373040 RepID=A0A7X0CDU3_9BURK|nr:hypothetical protein [Massilia aurea]